MPRSPSYTIEPWGTCIDTDTGTVHVYRRTAPSYDVEQLCDEWPTFSWAVLTYAETLDDLSRYSCRKCREVLKALGVAA